MRIREESHKRVELKEKEATQECPKCKQKIPISQYDEHIKLELLDPRWRENKERREDALAFNTLNSGEEIARNLEKYAQNKTDIVTGGDQPKQPVWDGQSANMSRTTANIAM